MKIGRMLAFMDAEEQAEILNELGYYLTPACKDAYRREMQICMLVDKLDGCGRQVVRDLAGFVELYDKSDKEKKQT